jgi:hypothetical protein
MTPDLAILNFIHNAPLIIFFLRHLTIALNSHNLLKSSYDQSYTSGTLIAKSKPNTIRSILI